MAEKTIVQKTPNFVGKPQVYFGKDDHNTLIYAHGYWITAERAVRCPCSSEGNSPQPICQNCGGTGFFYTNPLKCQSLITGINVNTDYRQWSPELIGTISITVEHSMREVVEFYNRIVLQDERALWTETLPIRTVNGQNFVFCTYAPTEIVSGWVFDSVTTPLVKISNSNLAVSVDNPYVIKLNNLIVPDNGVISINYWHRLEYHIIDIPHEVRASRKQHTTGQIKKLDMPVQGIGRLTHLIDGFKPNYDGSGIIVQD